MSRVPPEFFDGEQARAALAARDIGALYRLLRRVGISQRHIASLTGQSQSEVSEIILKGRQVLNVHVLERIADGLSISRAKLGVSYGEEAAPPATRKVSEDTKRRTLIAAGLTTTLSQEPLGDGLQLALPPSEELPATLETSHVRVVRAVTQRLRGVARYFGGQGDLFGAATTIYTRWLRADATEETKAALAAALAELHTAAGWCCYDSGLDGRGHFTRALGLGQHAQDAYAVANAAWSTGTTLTLTGHPNDALKFSQLGQLHLGGFRPRKPRTGDTDDPRIPTLTAKLLRQSATAYAVMQGRAEALRCLAEAHDGWEAPEAFEHGEDNLGTAMIQLCLGQLDAAEHSAASAVRAYGKGERVGRTMAELLHAEILTRAGEPQGLTLAEHAITETRTLHSVAARHERLLPLATALATRPGADAQELARTAHHLATTPTSLG